MAKNRLLFFVILIEGYAVLACELLAIRQMIPFVGSGTEVISIIISGVLLPLAVGYWLGGNAYARANARRQARGDGRFRSIRAILVRNIFWALVLFVPGLSYFFLNIFFSTLAVLGITGPLAQTALYALFFLVVPVLLLGQTVPLVSHYFSAQKLSRITGRMLFFSTTGSFLGSIFSTIVLMSTVGVHNTVTFTLGLLALLGFLLSRRKERGAAIFGALALLAFFVNSPAAMKQLHVVSDNAYNIVQIAPPARPGEATTLIINRSASSRIAPREEGFFPYIRYIQDNFVDTLFQTAWAEGQPRDILVLGAGGFTLGLEDDFNQYTFVDIDKNLKDVAERDFLQKKLGPNKKFIAASARAFVRRDAARYDLIILDTYTNTMSIPMETVTRDYLADVKARLKPDGIVVANVISSADFRDAFSARYQNTFSSVFPVHTRAVITAPSFNPWEAKTPDNANVLYVYYNRPAAQDSTVYTDDKNTYSMDR